MDIIPGLLLETFILIDLEYNQLCILLRQGKYLRDPLRSTIPTETRDLPSRVFRLSSLKYRVSSFIHSFPSPNYFTFSHSVFAYYFAKYVSLLHSTTFPLHLPN
jgi:hypothetical protein